MTSRRVCHGHDIESGRYEELKARNEMQHDEKEALREKHVQERLQKFSEPGWLSQVGYAMVSVGCVEAQGLTRGSKAAPWLRSTAEVQLHSLCLVYSFGSDRISFGAWKDTLEEGSESERNKSGARLDIMGGKKFRYSEVLHDLTRAVLPEQMIANLDAWVAHHKELLQPFASRIVEAIWNLLVALDDRDENDPLVTSGLGVLSAVACQDWAPSPFEDPKVLAALCERLVLTNLSLRESDLRLFHEDLQEFIARDVEGSDRDTRRWAAVDLVRSLRRRHDKEICDVVVASAGRLLREAAVADERKVAIYKH
ncbi:Cse1, partial [Symbiodinium sp. KB8]